MGETLKIYVGHDSREDIAWQVCRHSLRRHAAEELPIYPLKQPGLRELGIYTRGQDAATTEFSLSRFLTPYLAGDQGWSVFVDCDFLFSADIRLVLDGIDPAKAVYCVQHDYTPAHRVKMDGQAQAVYPRKNWSSFLLFNNAHPDVRALTPAAVNAASPSYLHRLQWVSDDSLIGSLPLGWNFLEGEYPKPPTQPQAVHFTNGGPWFDAWQDVDYAAEWRAERDLYLASV